MMFNCIKKKIIYCHVIHLFYFYSFTQLKRNAVVFVLFVIICIIYLFVFTQFILF